MEFTHLSQALKRIDPVIDLSRQEALNSVFSRSDSSNLDEYYKSILSNETDRKCYTNELNLTIGGIK